MRILVDADACPVKEIIVKVAKEFSLHVIMYIDTSHEYEDGYSEVVTISKGIDAVDFRIVNAVIKNDIVVTQDYGLAAMVLPKKATALNQNGFIFTDKNIDQLLLTRHINRGIRSSGGRHKGPPRRTKDMNKHFETSLRKLVSAGLKKER